MTRLLLWLPVLALGACVPEAEVKDVPDTPDAPVDDTGSILEDGLTTAVFGTISEDYAVGALATVSMADWSVTDALVDTPGDSIVVATGGDVYQLNRYGYDTVRIYTPGDWSAPRTELALPDLANPHDVAVCDGRAFISQYGRSDLTVIDPGSGLLAGTVDLSAYDDGDGTPEASRIVQADNGRLYVGLHNLDRTTDWGSVGGGVVEVDCTERAVTRSWDFADTDVYDYPADPSKIVVHADGEGIFLLDTTSGEAVAVVSSTDVGATVDGIAAFGDKAVAITTDPAGNYAIGCLDFAAGTYTQLRATDNFLVHIAGTGTGQAWISARTHWSNPAADTGALVYDIETCTALTDGGPIATVMAPSSIAFY